VGCKVALEEVKEDGMEFTLTGLGQSGGKEETYDVVIIGGGLRASRRASTPAGAA
jgi:hypothetical protein